MDPNTKTTGPVVDLEELARLYDQRAEWYEAQIGGDPARLPGIVRNAAEHATIARVLRAHPALVEALEHVERMAKAGEAGNATAWIRARAWLDKHGIYHGDLSESAVIAAVARAALALAAGGGK